MVHDADNESYGVIDGCDDLLIGGSDVGSGGDDGGVVVVVQRAGDNICQV